MNRRTLTRTKLVAALFAALVLGLTGARAAQAAYSNPVSEIQDYQQAIDSYWRQVLTAANHSYTSPKLQWYEFRNTQGQVVWAYCGHDRAYSMNSQFCYGSNTVQLSYAYLSYAFKHYGDYPPVVILAHEWGHAISYQLGWIKWADARHFYMGEELQADCYSGMFTRYALQRGWVTTGAAQQAVAWRTRPGGDPRPRPYTPGAHGTGSQRAYWFLQGYRSGSLAVCGQNLYDAIYNQR